MIPDNVKIIMQKLIDNGYQAHIVGGAIRDTILNLVPKDWDIFTDANGESILELFPQGNIIGGEERQKKILTVIVDGVEVSQYRSNGDRTQTGKSLREHVATCDFTINSIAMDIDENILDYKFGRLHIDKKQIHFVGSSIDRVKEDPLRIFRGIRFAVKYGFIIYDNNPFVNFEKFTRHLPKERIRDEFMKILVLHNGLKNLDYYDMLGWIIPEWDNCRECDGGRYHNEKLGEHLILALESAQKLTDNPLLMLAVFLHDIGKPLSKSYDETGIHFYDHQIIGAEYAEKWMREYKFSEKEISYVTTIIRHHMMGKIGNITTKTFTDICNDLNNNGVPPEDMLVQTFSDNQANLANPKLTYNEFIKNNGFLQKYYEIKYGTKAFNQNDLEIDGHIIMNYGFKGKEVGEIKNVLFTEVCNGQLINRKDRLIERVEALKEFYKVKHDV